MRLVVVEFMTLDGVMEAPGFEEHRSGRSGWAMQVGDEELQAWSVEQIRGADALLFGRTTWNIWLAFWTDPPEVARKMGEMITRIPKSRRPCARPIGRTRPSCAATSARRSGP